MFQAQGLLRVGQSLLDHLDRPPQVRAPPVSGTRGSQPEPSASGTRLTFTGTVSTRIPLVDKVNVLVFTQGRGQARNMDMVLAEVKKLAEVEAVEADG